MARPDPANGEIDVRIAMLNIDQSLPATNNLQPRYDRLTMLPHKLATHIGFAAPEKNEA